MIRGPRVTFPIAPVPAIVHLEGLVPGVEVHGWTGRWTRLSEMAAPSTHYTATVALHSAWRLEDELRVSGVPYGAPLLYEADGVYLDRPSWVAEYGRSIAEAAVARGELRADFLNTVTPYQLVGAALSVTRPWNLKVWRPGCLTGDTELVVNRAGGARRVRLRDLVFKFNGGVAPVQRRQGGGSDARWDLSIPTQTQSVNAEGHRCLNRVVRAWSSGVKPVFSLVTKAGRGIRATAEHPFLTPRGWVPLGDLRVGDTVLCMKQDGRSPWEKDEKIEQRQKKLRYADTGRMWNHPYGRLKVARRNDRPGDCRTCRVATHRVVAEATLNGMSYEAFVERIVDGNIDGLSFLDPEVYDVHHKDRNPNNNAPENLEIAKKKEHQEHHGNESHWRHVNPTPREDTIVSITAAGEEETFDLEMAAPFHNYVADGFIVHNSGKTAGALLDIMARPGDALILCPSKARKEWKSGGMASAAKFTHLDIHRVLPANVRSKADPERKDDYDFETYRQRMRAEGRRAIVVIGFESLRDHLDKARLLAPEILVIDEIHELGSSDRWAPVAKQDGKTTFKKAATEGGQATMAVAAMEVSQLRSLKMRSGLSGTPLDDGRPRRLWAVLDLLSPGGFGPYSRFKVRYCDYKEVNGYPDDRGASHVEELKARCYPIVHDVSYQESHGALPALRTDVDYIPASEQNPPDAFTAEFKRLSKLKYSGGSDRKTRSMTREAALAEACSRIRRRVLERVEEFLKGGGKVVILMTRKKMLRAWAERIRKMCPDTWEACGAIDATEDEEKFSPDIDAAVDAYAVHPGPCCLIGTFQAIGTSKDGMQYTDLAVVAQVPEKPGLWIQGRGRFERIRDKNNPFTKGQRSPIFWVPLAEGSAAEKEVGRLTRKFGPIEKFTDSPELREQIEKLDGTEGDDLLDSAADKLIRGDEGGEDETD